MVRKGGVGVVGWYRDGGGKDLVGLCASIHHCRCWEGPRNRGQGEVVELAVRLCKAGC